MLIKMHKFEAILTHMLYRVTIVTSVRLFLFHKEIRNFFFQSSYFLFLFLSKKTFCLKQNKEF